MTDAGLIGPLAEAASAAVALVAVYAARPARGLGVNGGEEATKRASAETVPCRPGSNRMPIERCIIDGSSLWWTVSLWTDAPAAAAREL